MKRIWIPAVALLGLLLASPLSAQTSLEIDCQPLVVYDISGHGIAGPIHQHLAVYSDGLTTISSLVLADSSADLTWVSPDRVYQLVEALSALGAFGLPDRWESVADMPATTVTVFEDNGANARHNTFSFFDTGGPRDPYRNVVATLESYIDEAFPAEP